MKEIQAAGILRKLLESRKDSEVEPPADKALDDALKIAISVLAKQEMKKPARTFFNGADSGNWEDRCPCCGKLFVKRITDEESSKPYIYYHSPWCTCGQKIDWRQEQRRWY